jgi:hypothetical protein
MALSREGKESNNAPDFLAKGLVEFGSARK